MSTQETDKNAIRELLGTYCFKLDAGLHEEMAALFTEDGTWDTAFGTGVGRDGIVAQLRKIAALSSDPKPRRIHMTTNIVIELEGETATARSNWMVFENSPQGPRISSGGEYRDRLAKRDRRWLFQYRKIDRFILEGGS